MMECKSDNNNGNNNNGNNDNINSNGNSDTTENNNKQKQTKHSISTCMKTECILCENYIISMNAVTHQKQTLQQLSSTTAHDNDKNGNRKDNENDNESNNKNSEKHLQKQELRKLQSKTRMQNVSRKFGSINVNKNDNNVNKISKNINSSLLLCTKFDNNNNNGINECNNRHSQTGINSKSVKSSIDNKCKNGNYHNMSKSDNSHNICIINNNASIKNALKLLILLGIAHNVTITMVVGNGIHIFNLKNASDNKFCVNYNVESFMIELIDTG